MQINLPRLKDDLIQLGWIGFTGDKNRDLPRGDQGITRLPFSKEYKEADEFVAGLMEEAGLAVSRDEVGNLFGVMKAEGTEETIVVGSHIDTVIQGGMFDGSLGVIAAVESLRILQENDYDNNYNLMVAVFNGEEGVQTGGYLGSRAFIGADNFSDEELSKLAQVGITSEDIARAAVAPEMIKNYLELHIEQGQILPAVGSSIGIVEGIVGITRYDAVVEGSANHAGTTPMHMRDDALIKASQMVLALEEKVNLLNQPDGRLVGTVGELEVKPGAPNVIPGEVDLTIELRDMEQANIEAVIEYLQTDLTIPGLSLKQNFSEESVRLDADMHEIIQAAAEELGYDHHYMLSGAGHDASPLASVTASGMIFVPSRDGISHSPEEWTEWSDVEKGANLILHTLIRLDNQD